MSAEETSCQHTPRCAVLDGQSHDRNHTLCKVGSTDQNEWVLVEKACNNIECINEHDTDVLNSQTSGVYCPASSLDSTEPGLPQEDLQKQHINLVRHFQSDGSTWDELGVTRVQAEYERERYRQCCRLLEATLLRLESYQEHNATRTGLHQQALSDIHLVLEQAEVQKRAETDMIRIESALFESPYFAAQSTQTQTESYQGLDDDDPEKSVVLNSWIRRAGDASITSERIAELDDVAMIQESVNGLERSPLVDCSEVADVGDERRRTLQEELICALREAEILKDRCIAEGLDPERAKHW
ncbi:hypothetical protein LTR27_008722 [Elasticomyces elasticus]|nr:hypothetical protein LTR27_008722 [Elasticomyces elasticus]